MRNPWVHDDVPESAGSVHRSRAKLLAILLWGALVAVVAATVLLTGDGPTDVGGLDSLWRGLTYAVGAVVALFALPLLLKLLAFSRTLAAIVFLMLVAAVGRFVITESDRIAVAVDAAAGAIEPIADLIEILDVVASLV